LLISIFAGSVKSKLVCFQLLPLISVLSQTSYLISYIVLSSCKINSKDHISLTKNPTVPKSAKIAAA